MNGDDSSSSSGGVLSIGRGGDSLELSDSDPFSFQKRSFGARNKSRAAGSKTPNKRPSPSAESACVIDTDSDTDSCASCLGSLDQKVSREKIGKAPVKEKLLLLRAGRKKHKERHKQQNGCSLQSGDSSDNSCSEGASGRQRAASEAASRKTALGATLNTKVIELLGDSDSDENTTKADAGRALLSSRDANRPVTRRKTRTAQRAAQDPVALDNTAETDCYTRQAHGQALRHTAEMEITLQRAREAKEELQAAQCYCAEEILDCTLSDDDVDNDDEVEIIECSTGHLIRLTLRTTIKSVNAGNTSMVALNGKSEVFKIHSGEKLQRLMDDYRQKNCQTIASHWTVSFLFDGKKMNLGHTTQHYDIVDDDLIDAVVTHVVGSGLRVTGSLISQDDDRISIKTQTKGGDAAKTHLYQLRRTDPFSKLLKAYREKHERGPLAIITLEYNGQKLDLSSSPQLLGMADNSLVEICDEMERQKQMHRASVASVLPLAKPNQIVLKVRINGSQSSIQDYRIAPSITFQFLMNEFCTRNTVRHSDCKFFFDGGLLHSNASPQDEDLEGEEIIDVQVDKNALKMLDPEGPIAPPVLAASAPLRINNEPPSTSTLRQAAFSANASVLLRSVKLNAAPPANVSTGASSPSIISHQAPGMSAPIKTPITIFTYRNNNTLSKPKKFRIYNTDSVAKLKKGYNAYYRSKGCRSVCFYFNDVKLDDDNKTFVSLGVKDKDVLHAMENCKKYIPKG